MLWGPQVASLSLATQDTVQLTEPFAALAPALMANLTIGGSRSAVATVTTGPASAPAAPPAPTVLQVTGGAVRLSMSAPLDTGGVPITSYEVEVRVAGSNASFEVAADVAVGSTPGVADGWVGGLSSESGYELRSVARNSVSSCTLVRAASSITTLNTSVASLATAPRSFVVAAVTGGQVTLTWVAPVDNGGQESVRYLVQQHVGGALLWTTVATTTPTVRTVTLSGLNASSASAGLQSYSWRVALETGSGVGAWSGKLKHTMASPTPPSAPINVTVANITGGAAVVRCAAPLDKGGRPIVVYTVHITRSSDSAELPSLAFNATSDERLHGLVRGLAPLTAYTVRVRASNLLTGDVDRIGTSTDEVAFSTTAVTAPSVLAAPVFAGSTGGSVTLTWTTPADTGGATVDTYTVHLNGAPAATVVGQTTTTVYGLTRQANPLLAAVTATNTFNLTSPMSPTTEVNPGPATLPGAPENLVLTPSGGAVFATWDAPVDAGGRVILRYHLYYRDSLAAGAFTLASAPTTPDGAVGGLSPTTSYDVYVAAVTSVGEGAGTPPTTVNTLAVRVPGEPSAVAVTSPGGDDARVTWDPPQDDGGIAVTGYWVRYLPVSEPSPTWVTLGSMLSASTFDHTVSGLANDVTYWFEVAAHNVEGQGVWSSEAVLRTTTPDGRVEDAQVAMLASSWVDLVWAAPRAVSGVTFTGYRVWANATGAWRDVVALPLNTSSYRVANLTADSEYWFAVAATNTTARRLAAVDGDTRRGRRLSTNGATPTANSVLVQARTASEAGAVFASGASGVVTSGAYPPNTTSAWVISGTADAVWLRLRFTSFDVECDHDAVSVHEVIAGVQRLVWQGGCPREQTFDVTVSAPRVRVELTSDLTVEGGGFRLEFTSFSAWRVPMPPTSTDDACPRRSGNHACSGLRHGLCLADGTCVCEPGYTGEDCATGVVCPGHWLCDDMASVVSVAPWGDDGTGTGWTGPSVATAFGGVSAKPVRTVQRALELVASRTKGVVLLQPGLYNSTGNCGVTLNETVQRLTGVRGMRQHTVVDCEAASRFVTFNASTNASLAHVTVINGAAAAGAGVRVAHKATVSMHDVTITGCHASEHGGAVAAQSQSSLRMSEVHLEGNSAAVDGGGVYVEQGAMLEAVCVAAAVGANITGNSALGGSGGGLVCVNCSVAAQAAPCLVFDGNFAALSGGNVAMQGSGCSLSHASVVRGRTNGVGGGVGVNGTNHSMASVRCGFNHAAISGGGVALGAGAHVRANGMHVHGNTAGQTGGGMVLGDAASWRGPTYVSDSVATDAGGGVWVTGSATLQDVNVSGNAALRGAGVGVGAGGHLDCGGLNVTGNHASERGGALFVSVGAGVSTQGAVRLARNSAGSAGGGVFIAAGAYVQASGAPSSAQATIAIIGNSAAQGGGVALASGASVRGVSVTQCSASEVGGGVYAAANGTSVVEDASVALCSSNRGGGIAVGLSSTLALANVSVTGNSATHGGGVWVGANASVVASGGGVRMRHNHAVARGGGLACSGCRSVSAVDSLALRAAIANNSAASGGGVACFDGGAGTPSATACTVANMTISHNTATGSSGGGIAIVSASRVGVSLVNVRLAHNEALAGCGGALYASGASVTVSNTSVGAHAADTGGGLCLASANVTSVTGRMAVSDCTASREGGGAHVSGSSRLEMVDVRASVSRSITAHGGGGVFVAGASDVSLVHVGIIECDAASRGGGLRIGDGVTMTTCALEGVDIWSNTAHVAGGGASFDAALVSVLRADAATAGLVLSNCSAPRGGGLAVARTTLVGAVIATHNVATGPLDSDGGGNVYAEAGANAASELTCLHGQATHGSGGGVLVAASAGLHCSTVVAVGNIAGLDGGGIAVDAAGVAHLGHANCSGNVAGRLGGCLFTEGLVTVNSSTVQHNLATSGGGGLAVQGHASALHLHSALVSSNAVPSLRAGGGVYVGPDGVARLAFSVVTDCTAHIGAAVYALHGTVSIRHSTVSQSSAGLYGGGVALIGAPSLRTQSLLENTTFTKLVAVSGGAWFASDALLHAQGCSVAACGAHEFGGAATLEGGSATLDQCHFTGNSAGYDGGAVHTSGGRLNATNCLVSGNAAVRGAGILVGRSSRAVLLHCVAEHNSALRHGGAVYFSRKSTSQVLHSTVRSNVAGSGGGGMYAAGATVSMTSSVLTGNSASGDGGGIAITVRARWLVFVRGVATTTVPLTLWPRVQPGAAAWG